MEKKEKQLFLSLILLLNYITNTRANEDKKWNSRTFILMVSYWKHIPLQPKASLLPCAPLLCLITDVILFPGSGWTYYSTRHLCLEQDVFTSSTLTFLIRETSLPDSLPLGELFKICDHLSSRSASSTLPVSSQILLAHMIRHNKSKYSFVASSMTLESGRIQKCLIHREALDQNADCA